MNNMKQTIKKYKTNKKKGETSNVVLRKHVCHCILLIHKRFKTHLSVSTAFNSSQLTSDYWGNS